MSKIHNAPELKLYINNQLAGYANDFRYSVVQGQKAFYGVDSPFPQEIAQGAAPSLVEGTMTVFRPKNGSPEAWGFMTPRASKYGSEEDLVTGGFKANGMENPGSTALGSGKYSIIRLEDRKTSKVVANIYFVMFSAQSWSVGARGIMMGTLSFQGMTVDHPVVQR